MKKKTTETPAPTAGGNWWDKLGKPQYGGEMVIRASRNIVNFDPYNNEMLTTLQTAWMERLHADDWTMDPTVFDYKPLWHPPQYLKGQLAESWELTGPSTFVAYLQKGIHWQDIPPANGREVTAEDIVFHFNRLYGLGGGFTQPSPFHKATFAFQELASVTAADKYTVVFNWKIPSPELITEAMLDVKLSLCLENPDAVKKWGDLNDWHHAIGTGPFILKDFVSESHAILVKNPHYWGHDERYPQNQLPYIDTIKYIYIPDNAVALAEICAGKIDVIDVVSPVQAQAIKKTNPEILQIPTPLPPTITLDPRLDVAPFNDIRVRKAMQMAIDLPAIARDYYRGTVEPYPDTITSRYMQKFGFGFAYEEWTQDLKQEYAYNPVAARKLLADAGHPNGFRTNIVADAAGDMALMQIVKGYFAAVGIDMEIRPMETAAWQSFVQINHQHDQLAHRPAGPLGKTSAPLMDLNRFQTGAFVNYQMISDPVIDALCGKAMAAANIHEVKQIFRDANEYVARQHFAVSLLQLMSYSLCQPWVKGFNAQFGSSWGSSRRPGHVELLPGALLDRPGIKKEHGALTFHFFMGK